MRYKYNNTISVKLQEHIEQIKITPQNFFTKGIHFNIPVVCIDNHTSGFGEQHELTKYFDKNKNLIKLN
jgi:predicted metal-dependent RNase